MTRESSAHIGRSQLSEQSPQLQDRSETDAAQSRNPGIRLMVDIVSISIGLIGIGLWIPSFYPDIRITHRDSSDPNRPFAAAFPVTNDSLTAIFEVFWVCRLNAAEFADGTKVTPFNSTGFLTHRLDRGSTVDLACSEPFSPNNPLMFADIEIGISFTPHLIHKQMAACGHFFLDRYHPAIGWRESVEDPQHCDDWVRTLFTPGQPLRF